MQFEIIASSRALQGTGASRRLRRDGKVPGILYGAGKDVGKIEIDHNALYHQLKQEVFHASILTLNLDGQKEQVLLRDVQMHPFKPLVLHVDFQHVSQTEKIHVKIPLHFINADIAPGVKLSGGNVSHILNEIDVACLPKDLPEFLEVDLVDLAAGHSIHLSELKVPQGVEITALAKGEDLAIATITIPRGSKEDEAAEAKPAEGAAPAPATPASGSA